MNDLLTIQSIPGDILRYIVKEFLDTQDEENLSLTSKLWLRFRNEELYRGHSLGTQFDPVRGRLSCRPFRFYGKRASGTEGSCYKVMFRGNQQMYAMKKARVYPKGEGVPYYMLREIEFLRGATHANISALAEISLRDNELLMFFPYSPRTLHEALNPPNEHGEVGVALPLHITKRFLQQILQAVSYCHDHGVLHRNIKPKHLLLCEKTPTRTDSTLLPRARSWELDTKEVSPMRDLETCTLLLADFALVRTSVVPTRKFTPEVVTLWYRAPEILLGASYFAPVDVWSVGCVFAEMLLGKPFISGVCEINQLFEIFVKLGTPTEASWPGVWALPNVSCEFPRWPQIGLRRFFPDLDPAGLDLLEGLLCLNPAQRLTAREALDHPFFTGAPLRLPRPVAPVDQPQLGVADARLLPAYLQSLLAAERAVTGSYVVPVVVVVAMAATATTTTATTPPPVIVSKQLRGRAVQTILEINDMFEMSTRTSFLSVALMDRYLATLPADAPWPELLDITCVHMASKCEDVAYIGVNDLVVLPHVGATVPRAHHHSSREKLTTALLTLQQHILAALRFRLHVPTTLDFIYALGFSLGLDISTPPLIGPTTQPPAFSAACVLAEAALGEERIPAFAPSCVALAVWVYVPEWLALSSPLWSPAQLASLLSHVGARKDDELAYELMMLIHGVATALLESRSRRPRRIGLAAMHVVDEPQAVALARQFRSALQGPS